MEILQGGRPLQHPARMGNDVSRAARDIAILEGARDQSVLIDEGADGRRLRQAQPAYSIQLQFHLLYDGPCRDSPNHPWSSGTGHAVGV